MSSVLPKLRSITDRFVMSMSSTEVDTFLAEIDQSVEESRRVMRFVFVRCCCLLSLYAILKYSCFVQCFLECFPEHCGTHRFSSWKKYLPYYTQRITQLLLSNFKCCMNKAFLTFMQKQSYFSNNFIVLLSLGLIYLVVFHYHQYFKIISRKPVSFSPTKRKS